MSATESDFHEFVVGFADPLARLAYLLTAGLDMPDPHVMAAAALAQARRHWREAQATGAPEPHAVEALLASLPRSWRHGRGDAKPGSAKAADPPALRAGGPPLDPHARYRRPTSPTSAPGAASTSASSATDAISDVVSDADGETPDVDVRLIRDTVWNAWQTLEARQRVPLVFADPAVASRRLAGIELPEGFASPRRYETLAAQALSRLYAAVPEVDLSFVLTDTLSEHARDIDQATDPYPAVVEESRRGRRRVGLGAAAVVAVLVAGAIVVVNVAQSPQRASVANGLATTAPPSTASSSTRSSALPTGDQAFAPDTALPSPGVLGAALAWPTRGNLSGDKALIADVAAAFSSTHGDIIDGHPRVLLVDDTPWFRVAVVVAATPLGMLRSWYYGPPGSTALSEASMSLGDDDPRHGAIAGFLSDGAHSELVVVGQPTQGKARLGDIYLGAPLSAGVVVPADDGIVVRDMSGVSADSIYLEFASGDADDWSGRVPSVVLAPMSRAADDVALAAAVTVDRGTANPELLRTALAAALKAVPLSAMDGPPVVLWGGADEVGNHGIVLRVTTFTGTASLVVAWAEDPSGALAYPISSGLPDFPTAFAYVGAGGARIGVLPLSQATRVGVAVDGVGRGVVPVQPDGFASVPAGAQHGLLADQQVQVNLLDSYDHLLGQTTLPKAPHETTAQAMRGVPAA